MHAAITRYYRLSSSTINYLIPAGLLVVGEDGGHDMAQEIFKNVFMLVTCFFLGGGFCSKPVKRGRNIPFTPSKGLDMLQMKCIPLHLTESKTQVYFGIRHTTFMAKGHSWTTTQTIGRKQEVIGGRPFFLKSHRHGRSRKYSYRNICFSKASVCLKCSACWIF